MAKKVTRLRSRKVRKASHKSLENARSVGTVRHIDKVKVGKPTNLSKVASMRSKIAFGGGGGGFAGGGFSGGIGGGYGGHGTVQGTGGNFYSPELSTDFLELPQSLHEQWNYYRFFYRTEPFVGQAIDVHTDLPISKVRIGLPQAKNVELAKASRRFCTKWSRRIGLLRRLLEIVHDYYLLGEVNIFVEDNSPDIPQEVTHELIRQILTEDEEKPKDFSAKALFERDNEQSALREEWVLREDADERAFKWMKKNYKGWSALRVLPPEQVHMESFNFTDAKLFELILDSKTKDIVERAASGDERAAEIVNSMDPLIVKAIVEGKNVPLNTDPDAGSFIYYMARKRSQYSPRGSSILERCIRTLVFRDKLRQANTSIASRHMTPIRVVWADDMDANDVESLRDQVDMALMDPDYSIISNFQINWEEPKGQRLLDLAGEYDLTDRQLYAGLGVTESLLSGESSYSGDRINLEIINTRYLLLRELIQEFVEEQIFKPMCARMGFVEIDEDGDEVVIYPSLTFSRLPLRDNADTFDIMFNLYQKGSLPVSEIYEVLNLDPQTIDENLHADLWTLRDATSNEVVRGIYNEAARELAENSNISKILAQNLGLKFTPSDNSEDRF